MISLPNDIDEALENAWQRTQRVPGFLVENEARFLGTLAAVVPSQGTIVEIGSFKGRSTVMLASIAARYAQGPVVAIDPHAGLTDSGHDVSHQSPTFDEFLASLKSAGVEQHVEVRRAFSRDVAKDWNRPIRLLWIDGDHSYKGCKGDFTLFSSHLIHGAVVAIHDSLHLYEGPIRVFTEDILRSDRFGAAGFVHSIAWSQYRPDDGALFHKQRAKLERRAARLIPFVLNGGSPKGLRKLAYKLHRSRVPRKAVSPAEWIQLLSAT